MTDIRITANQIMEILKEKVPEWFAEKLTEGYNNPLKDAVEDSIKEHDGIIKKLVNEMLTEILNDDTFKVELKQSMISKIIAKGLSL